MLMLILSMVTSASHINMAVNCRKKRLECAIVLQAILAAEAQEGKDMRPEITNFKYEVEHK